MPACLTCATFALKLPHDVGRQIIDDQIDRALAEFETAHRVVGDDFENAIIARPPCVIPIVSRDAIVGDELRPSRYGPVPIG